MAQNFYMPITSSNINRFSKKNLPIKSAEMCSNINTKDPTTPVVILSCNMSDIALKQVTAVTNCVINVAQAWHVASKQFELKSRRLCCFGELFHGWFINVDNSWQFWSTEWGKLSQRLVNCVIGQWRRWLECIVQQQSGHIEHLMWKLRDVAVTLDNNWDNKKLVLLLIFKMLCYKYRLVFNCCFKNTDILLGSVATHLRCGEIFSDNVTTNFLLIPTVKKFKIGLYLTKLLVYKNVRHFLAHPVCLQLTW